MQTDMYICKLSPTHPLLTFPFFPFVWPSSPPLHIHTCLFQVSGVSLDGLFDAEQHGGQPLVQAGHRVKLLYGLRERLAVLLLVGLQEFLRQQTQETTEPVTGHWLSFAEFLTYFDETMMKTKEVKAGDRKKMYKWKWPLTVSALWSLKRLETSPHTSRWPTETQRRRNSRLAVTKRQFQVSWKQCQLVCHLCIQLIHDEVAQWGFKEILLGVVFQERIVHGAQDRKSVV